MTIRHTLTRRDLLALNLHLLMRKRFIWALWGLLVCFVSYGDLHRPEIASRGLSYQFSYFGLMATMYFVVLFGFTVTATSVLILTRKNTGVLGEHRLTITDQGIVEATEHNESLFKWSAYKKTVSTRGFLILRLTEAMYHGVPRNRPLLEGDLLSFEAELNSKTKSA